MYLNKIIIVGNLTRDPELKALPSGQKVASFSLATNRTWKGTDGEKNEAVEYHNLNAFGKQAEVIAQYCTKGSQLLVEGRIQTRSWEDKETAKKVYRTEIIVENFQFGNKPPVKKEDGEDEIKEEEEIDEEPIIDPSDGRDLTPTEDIPF